MNEKEKKLLIVSTILQIAIIVFFNTNEARWIFSTILWFSTYLMYQEIKEDYSFLNLKPEK